MKPKSKYKMQINLKSALNPSSKNKTNNESE